MRQSILERASSGARDTGRRSLQRARVIVNLRREVQSVLLPEEAAVALISACVPQMAGPMLLENNVLRVVLQPSCSGYYRHHDTCHVLEHKHVRMLYDA